MMCGLGLPQNVSSIFYGYHAHVDVSLGLPFRRLGTYDEIVFPAGALLAEERFWDAPSSRWMGVGGSFWMKCLTSSLSLSTTGFCEREITREVLAKRGRSDAGLLGRYPGSTEWSF